MLLIVFFCPFSMLSNIYNKWFVVSVPAPWKEGEPYQGWTPCTDWCAQHFAPRTWSYDTEGVFQFKYEQDSTLFALRWL